MFPQKLPPLTGNHAESLLSRDRTQELAFAAIGNVTVAVMLIASAGLCASSLLKCCCLLPLPALASCCAGTECSSTGCASLPHTTR